MSITDLTGIEAFVNFTRLDCDTNDLSSLDVSKNTALMELRCFSNQLTSLDVSNNPALAYLYCNDNSTSSIDISGNSAMIRFQCDANNLESLNVANGNNTALTLFIANENPNLTCIQVDDVAYAESNWSENKDTTASFSTECEATASIIDNEFNNAIEIYPNPVESILNITLPTSEILLQAEVYSLLGKKIISTKKQEINVENLKLGVYLLKIENKKGKVAIRKFVKE